MVISLIVAVSSNNVIGKDNQLPWHLPEDMKYFKNTTWAMPVVMGRKTFASLGKALPGRTNVVITRQQDWKTEGVKVVNSFDEAVGIALQEDVKEIFIIGGAEIFKAAIPVVQRMYITRIHHEFEGDVFFPAFNEEEWELVSVRDCVPDENNIYAYTFQVWERKEKTE
ncbi:MAG: dihydrofolate reductase [Terrimonas sp.]|nr:dihydrofolate reductase [Terrimonas sp.]